MSESRNEFITVIVLLGLGWGTCAFQMLRFMNNFEYISWPVDVLLFLVGGVLLSTFVVSLQEIIKRRIATWKTPFGPTNP